MPLLSIQLFLKSIKVDVIPSLTRDTKEFFSCAPTARNE
jgi:hypothetical protein